MIKHKLTFEDYEEIGYNAEWDTWGVHGVNVYEDGHYIGEIPWETEDELAEMTDDEISAILLAHGIIPNFDSKKDE